ncbi:conserved hypothetical protein [Ricinus communis]|uniref:RNase H type-1 domain-containing protein n=1 Tax=Ricinus communis TaxID=3988 RepID=B9T0C4_RICCO|nr:conserved hypothetical protein [Ricinus communis]
MVTSDPPQGLGEMSVSSLMLPDGSAWNILNEMFSAQDITKIVYILQANDALKANGYGLEIDQVLNMGLFVPPKVINLIWRATILSKADRLISSMATMLCWRLCLFQNLNYMGLWSIVRTHDGSFVAARRFQVLGLMALDIAEAISCQEGLSWLKKLGLKYVELESNSQLTSNQVVHLIAYGADSLFFQEVLEHVPPSFLHDVLLVDAS